MELASEQNVGTLLKPKKGGGEVLNVRAEEQTTWNFDSITPLRLDCIVDQPHELVVDF